MRITLETKKIEKKNKNNSKSFSFEFLKGFLFVWDFNSSWEKGENRNNNNKIVASNKMVVISGCDGGPGTNIYILTRRTWICYWFYRIFTQLSRFTNIIFSVWTHSTAGLVHIQMDVYVQSVTTENQACKKIMYYVPWS